MELPLDIAHGEFHADGLRSKAGTLKIGDAVDRQILSTPIETRHHPLNDGRRAALGPPLDNLDGGAVCFYPVPMPAHRVACLV